VLAAGKGILRFDYKTRNEGCSWFPVLPAEEYLQLSHFVLYLPNAGDNNRVSNLPVVVGQISFVAYPKAFVGEIAESTDSRVFPQRLADIINVSSFILSARVGNEQNPVGVDKPLGGDVNESIIGSLPNGMELRFDQNLLPFPDSPAYHLFSTIRGNMLWHDSETFTRWFIGQGLHWRIERFAMRDNVVTEGEGVTVV
jgi:hypothetical protein